jgi:hypothetical protein
MAEETANKPGLSEAYPDLEQRHARLRALCQEARAARARGEVIGAGLAGEAASLLAWVDEAVARAAPDAAAFQARVDRDRAAFASALRLAGDEMVARQLLASAGELRAELSEPR